MMPRSSPSLILKHMIPMAQNIMSLGFLMLQIVTLIWIGITIITSFILESHLHSITD